MHFVPAALNFHSFISSFPVSLMLMMFMAVLPLLVSPKVGERTSPWRTKGLKIFWVFCWTCACLCACGIWFSQREWLHVANANDYGSMLYFAKNGFNHAQALHYHLAYQISVSQFQNLHYRSIWSMVWYDLAFMVMPVLLWGCIRRRDRFADARPA